MKERGYSLLELLVVIAILGSLLGIAAMSGRDWLERIRVEGQTRELYVDLMNARIRALQENRLYFVNLPDTPAANQYIIYEDTSPSPDGDGVLQTSDDRVVMTKTTRVPIQPHMSLGSRTFHFGKNGLVSHNGRIQFASSVESSADCITIFTTRILLGKWNESTSTCIAQ